MSWPSCLNPRRRHRKSEHGSNPKKKPKSNSRSSSSDERSLNAKTVSYSFYDLANATRKFSESNLIGRGGFGKVFKGVLRNQLVAVKQLGHNGRQGNQEFLMEVLMLSFLEHPNLVNLMGYCAEGDQRILVYEYLPNGSLDDHLFGNTTLEWNTRIKIAIGIARGLEYLHCKADPPVIHRDLKPANVLLDAEYNAKLSDFGLAKLGPVGVKTHVSTRVMGTCGYCAPDYAKSGCLTLESDIYSFGVVLLEIITGQRAFDPSRGHQEQDLVAWASSLLRNQSKYVQLVDPRLQGRFSVSCLRRLVAVTAMCLMEERKHRPLIPDVLLELEHMACRPYKSEAHTGGYLSTPSSPMLPVMPPSPMLWGTPKRY